MAVFNLAINYPDGEGPRIMAALKTYYSVGTNAEAQEAFRLAFVAALRDLVYRVERDAAIQVAAAAVVTTNPT